MTYSYDSTVEAQTCTSLWLTVQPANGDPKARERLCLNKNKIYGSYKMTLHLCSCFMYRNTEKEGGELERGM